MLDKEVISKTLNAAPGPLPWYGRSAGNRIYSKDLELEWRYEEEVHQSLLVKRGVSGGSGASIFGVGKTYCYPKSLSAEYFVLWWQQRQQLEMGAMQFRVFNASGLRPLEHWRDDWNEQCEFLIGTSETASLSIPAELNDGVNQVALPAEFAIAGETLLLVSRATTGVDICIWKIDPANHQITVLPQRWWNEADVDFGYQWITRVAREPASGLIVGDGIRINPFVLDSSGLKRLG